jgi:FkbM family methyltransferase
MHISSTTLQKVSNCFDKNYFRLQRRGIVSRTRHVLWRDLLSLCPVKRLEVKGDDGITRLVRLNSLAEVTAAIGRTAEDGVASTVEQLRPGHVFVDIGANAGRYSLIASRLVGPTGMVYAFEPAPDTFQVLQRNCEINDAKNIVLVNAAVSSEDGEAEMSFGSDSGWSTLHQDWLWHVGKENAARRVKVRTLNVEKYLEAKGVRRVDLIKIDVEGHEIAILKSLKSMIDPAVVGKWVVEVHRPIVQPEEVAAILSSGGYHVTQSNEFVYAV